MSRTISFSVSSRKRVEAIDVTAEVQQAVSDSGLEAGLAAVFVPHTTCALFVNEFESNLVQDCEKFFSSLAPGSWKHDSVDGNAGAHLVNSLVGVSKVFLVEGGKLVLGSWQSVVLLELDGPRSRRVMLKCVGEKWGKK